MAGKKRRGSVPQHKPSPNPPEPAGAESGYPILCLKHLQNGWGIDTLSPDQCQEFLIKWHKRTAFTWKQLVQHDKHGLGHENIPASSFKPQIPEDLERDRYMVFRHQGNLPFAGFRSGDIFHVLWIEARYNDLYFHGRK